MTEPPTPLEQLKAALADRYRLERELSQGGMATVYLAQTARPRGRAQGAAPELAAVLGGDRFLRDRGHRQAPAPAHPAAVRLRRAEAALLRDAVGQGETLRARLPRERQLRSTRRSGSPRRLRRARVRAPPG